MGTLEIIGQIVGFVAIAVAFISFQAKRRASILIIQSVANVIWAIHFFMIGSFAGAVVNAYCVVRNLIYAQKDRWRWVGSWITPAAVAIGAVTISVISANSWIDYLLLPSTIVSSLAFYLNDEKKIRAFSIFVAASWLVYNIIEFSISGMCAELFNLTSITVAIIRFRKFKLMTADGARLTEKPTHESAK